MGHIEIVKTLLKDPRIDINAANIQGATPLSACCSKYIKNKSTLDIIGLLLKHPNIDPRIPTSYSVVSKYFALFIILFLIFFIKIVPFTCFTF